jgi:hypothetical protein
MARELGDVLHLFAPELAGPESAVAPIVGVPIARPDPTAVGLLRNLAVETARKGARVSLLAPPALADDETPSPGGFATPAVDDDDPAALARSAEQAWRSAPRFERAFVLAAFPSAWLAKASEVSALLRWTLVFVRPDEASLTEATWALEAIATQSPAARLGVTVHGVRTITEARDCFEHLALRIERRLGSPLTSYGVLIDDVRLSRSIVTGRPISLASPQSSAARALADVAALLVADAGADRDG